MEYEAKRLEMEEKVAKSQVRAKILDLLDMPPLAGEEDAKGRNIMHNKQMSDTNSYWTNSMRTGRNLSG